VTTRIPSSSQNARTGEVERVYRQLRQWLVDAVLPPGEFLSEPDLARRCQTSRTPVREACMRLHQDRWLTRFPQKGFLVTPISVRDIVDLYQFRKLLECFAVETVARTASPAQVAELRTLVEPENHAPDDLGPLIQANEAFHLRLAALAGNERVLDQLALTLAFAHRLDILFLQDDPTWIAHQDILGALERHDSAAARGAMAAHLDYAQDCLVKRFGNSGPRCFPGGR
jgi:DNA-binding GntR family transcriptional regulator